MVLFSDGLSARHGENDAGDQANGARCSMHLRCAVMQGHCDMDSFGGGWLMCYTTAGEVHVSRETAPVEPGATYGRDGYRADCRHYPFNQAWALLLPGCCHAPALVAEIVARGKQVLAGGFLVQLAAGHRWRSRIGGELSSR